MEQLEEMRAFFTARIDDYDRHMLEEVPGCREGYVCMAALLPKDMEWLLDLGCGTGLELDAIFERFPSLHVTGVDFTPAMLERLRDKYPDQALNLMVGDYRTIALDSERYDASVSFQTLHHLFPDEKLAFYTRLRQAIKPGGCYIEGDYMLIDPQEEAFYFQEATRLRAEQGLSAEALIHYDIPCTVDHQIDLLTRAGFAAVQMVWREENTTIITAQA